MATDEFTPKGTRIKILLLRFTRSHCVDASRACVTKTPTH